MQKDALCLATKQELKDADTTQGKQKIKQQQQKPKTNILYNAQQQ